MIRPGDIHRFLTPAKINLYLRIQRQRPDGYHELLLDFIPVSICDRIELQLLETERLILEGNLAGLDAEENLVVKAVRVLEKESGKRFPIHIRLDKRIPTGAGLGGGSGNAAGMLVMLNRLCELSISEQRLKALALQLGADVPFFITPQPSLAGGIGERLTPLPHFEPLHLLLVYPGFSISTAEAYRHCIVSGSPAALSTYDLREICGLRPEMNVFWVPLVRLYPELEACRTALLSSGACAAGLSGSGSTVFGVFRTKQKRDEACAFLEGNSGWQVFPCESLRSYEYT